MGVVVGVLLALGGLRGQITFNAGRWMLLAAAVFALGFLARVLVISWRPPGIRRDPDHHSIIFTWWA